MQNLTLKTAIVVLLPIFLSEYRKNSETETEHTQREPTGSKQHLLETLQNMCHSTSILGDLVVVEGKLKNNNYTDRNGKKHSEMYVQSNNISLLRKKGLSPEAPQTGYTASSQTQKNQLQQYTPQPQFQQQQQNVVSKNGRSYIQQTNLNNSNNIQYQQPAPNRNNNNNYGYGNGAGYVQNSEPPF